MKFNDNDLQKLQKLSYNYSLYRTGNFDLADEISMKTIGVFLLKADSIESDKSSKWIINTSKIHIQSHYRIEKKDNDNIKKYHHDLLEKVNINLNSESDSKLKEAFIEVLQTLNIEETKTILLYFQCDMKIKTMSQLLDVSYDALRKKISRIKRKLKAETFKKLGGIASKTIVTPQLNKLIVDFLKSFKINLEANTLEKMYYYFSKIDLDNYNPSYEISRILDYEIKLIDFKYKVWVFYKNKSNDTDSFNIEFFIDEKNHLKIITPPQKSQKVMTFKSDSEEGKKILQMINSVPVGRTGISKLSSEELENMLKEFKKNN